MNNDNDFIPSQDQENSLQEPDNIRELESPEKVEINFNSHLTLISHLNSIEEEERDRMIEAFFNSNRTDKNWEDIVQRGFLGYFCESGDEENAKKVIELCSDHRSQEGRIKKFENFFGKYKGRVAEIITPKITDEERKILQQNYEINSTSKFREALDLGLLELAETWIREIEKTKNYKNLTGITLDNFIRDRRRELREEVEKR